MRRAAQLVGWLIAAALLAGCAAERAEKKAEPAESKGASQDGASARSLAWVYQDVLADTRGRFLDVAAPAADDIWAVAQLDGARPTDAGRARLLHYDGHRWEHQSLPAVLDDAHHWARLTASGPDNVWLLASRTGDDEGYAVARWDGKRWQRMPSPPPLDRSLGNPLALAADNVWIPAQDKALHWDGDRWRVHPLPDDTGMQHMAGEPGGEVWAVGGRSAGPGVELGQHSQPVALRWDGDGDKWVTADTPVYRFPDPQPPEVSAGLYEVVAVGDGVFRARGQLTYNHGEGGEQPSDRWFTLRWDGSRWSDVSDTEPACAKGGNAASDGRGGLVHYNHWHLSADGKCRKISRDKLPATGGITPQAQQSLWFARIVPVPGTDRLIGVGHMQVNQSGDPLSRPVVATVELP